MKECTDCHQLKELSEFGWLWKKKGYLRSYCKSCNVARSIKWQKDFPEKHNAKSKKSYYHVNR